MIHENRGNTFVYTFTCGDFVKVGCSRDTERRLMTFHGALPYQIEVRNKFQYRERASALHVEREVHKKLKGLGLHHVSEWFVFSQETVAAIESVIAEFTQDVMTAHAERNKAIFEISRGLPYKPGIGRMSAVRHLQECGFHVAARGLDRGCFSMAEDGSVEAMSCFVEMAHKEYEKRYGAAYKG